MTTQIGKKPEPGQDGFVEYHKAHWRKHGYTNPTSFIVIEYWGDGDPAFGGCRDDRALGTNGLILDQEFRLKGEQPATFSTLEEVHAACQAITNRRANSLLGIAPTWN